MSSKMLYPIEIAKRCARDIPEGVCVNLGIGIPTLVGNYINEGKEVLFHSENGILGVGNEAEPEEKDPSLVNVSLTPVTLVPGGSFINHVDSFVIIRGGHIDISIMGAYQVSQQGDLANWITDPNAIPAIGGAMDLAIGAKEVYVTMRHITKNGEPKIVKDCSYPLTAKNAVKRIYTDLSVIDVTDKGLVLQEIAPGISVEEIQSLTDAPLLVSEDLSLLKVNDNGI